MLKEMLAKWGVRARKRAVILALVWTLAMMSVQLLALVVSGLGWLVWVLNGLGVALLLCLAVDYVWLILASRQMSAVHVERQVNGNLPVQETSVVKLLLTAQLSGLCQNLRLTLIDHYPTNTQTNALPVSVLGADLWDKRLAVSYELVAVERGWGVFGGVDWLLSTPLGLLDKFYATKTVDGVSKVRILPNFRANLSGTLLLQGKRSGNGVIKKRQKGQGQDFHQIRSYVEGDSIRHVHWKATARQQRLMTKEFVEEAEQELIFLLDCGQSMRHAKFADDTTLMSADDNMSNHLDDALDAMLLLTTVAVSQGDSVGLLTFGADTDRTIMATKGNKAISLLLNQTFDLTATMQTADYMAVATQALALQKRRSLFVMLTNVRTKNADELMNAVKLLGQKHQVIVINLYENDLKAYTQALPQSIDDALTLHSVQDYLNTQRQMNATLAQNTGAKVLGCTPQALPQTLMQAYWQVVQRSL